MPSPLKSPTATDLGLFPTGKLVVAPKEPQRSEDGSITTEKPSRLAYVARVFVPKEHAEARNRGRLREHSPQFYIGKGVITAGEYLKLGDEMAELQEPIREEIIGRNVDRSAEV